MDKPHIVVIGAGVIGLSTAIKLQEAGYKVDICARDLPGDRKTINAASAWAGAHHGSVATGADMRMHNFDARTFKVMSEMIERDPKGPLTSVDQVEYREQPKVEGPEGELSQLNLMSRYHPNFRWLPESDLPSGISHGATFTAILIDTPAYLSSLVSRFLSNSGQLHRVSTLPTLSSALSAHPSLSDAQLLVNCTGLGSRSLVNDQKTFPTRGQLVIVRAPWVKKGMTRLGKPGSGVYDYIIPRRNGLVVLGGCAEQNNWDSKPRGDMSTRIKTRCLALCPDLLPPSKRENGTIADLEVVEEAVGLRPTREGGIRLEVEEIEEAGRRLKVVHHYGHGGYGFQSSWGSAEAAVELVQTTLDRWTPIRNKL
ncbi:hypothetical protein JCM5353_004392 [Sporobolomyces roseus]